jgi:hypothetical protein
VLHREQIVIVKGGTIHRHMEIFTSVLRLTVQVIGSDKPPQRARLSLALSSDAAGKKPREWRRLPSFQSVRLDEQGVGTAELPSGQYSYTVAGGGVEPLSGQVFVATGQETPLQLQVKPAPKDEKKPGQNEGNARDANQRGNRGGSNRGGGNRGGGNRGGSNRGGGNRGGSNRGGGGNGRRGR